MEASGGAPSKAQPSSLAEEFSFPADQEVKKNKDGEDVSQELRKPADKGKGSQSKIIMERRHFPTAAGFSFHLDRGTELSGSKDGNQSGTVKGDSLKPDEPPPEFSSLLDPGRELSRSKDGSQITAIKDDSLDPGEPPAKLWKSGGNDEKGCLLRMSKDEPYMLEERKDDLCFSVVLGKKCEFGSECLFQHDIGKYLATKPPDLGDSCILFSLFGKCQYGATCRFAGAHLGKDFQNVVNEELWKEWNGKSTVRNKLMDNTAISTMLKDFPFNKSSDYLHCLDKVFQALLARRDTEVASARQPGASDPPASNESANLEAASVEVLDKAHLSENKGSLSMATESLSHPDGPKRSVLKTVGVLTDEDLIRLRPCEKRKLDLQGKLYLSPLRKFGSLPFRRICKRFGADITCTDISCEDLFEERLQTFASSLHRHETEDLFGIQLLGSSPEKVVKCAELINQIAQVDFVDMNAENFNSPFYKKGGGCALMVRDISFEQIVRGMDYVLDVPVTVTLRAGVSKKLRLAHTLIPRLRKWGASMATLHGRSKEDLYKNKADWSYIGACAKLAAPMPLFGNGDIFSFEGANRAMKTGVSGITIARGALIKPWIFTEIKEQRHWDISARERLDMLKDFTDYGLEYWGTDTEGVEKTRSVLVNWLSSLYRYIPVGLLERFPPTINDERPRILYGDYLENLMSSKDVNDWVKISELFLGPAPDNCYFPPADSIDYYFWLQ